ncbi:MAG: transposase [Planctomycetaceae bacterium]
MTDKADFHDLSFFRPDEPAAIIERRLPHWSQAGVVTFITWRAYDSLPNAALRRFHAERNAWLKQRGISARTADWREKLSASGFVGEFHRLFSLRWHDLLDQGHGDCVLAQPEMSELVMKSLLHFHGDRYLLTDAVVMPNHVHMMVAFPDESSLLVQCESWKHFTAREINRILRRKERFWQQDGFDHLIRNADAFERTQAYIANNSQKARLKPGQSRHYSRHDASSHHAPRDERHSKHNNTS